MKKRILLLTTILVLVVSTICVGSTFSWFTTTDNIKADHLKTGKLNYTIQGAFISAENENEVLLIEPGDQLLEVDTVTPNNPKPIYLTNASSINSCVKVRIEATLTDPKEGSIPESADRILEFDFENDWKQTPEINEWIYSKDSGAGVGVLLPSEDTPTVFNIITSAKLKQDVKQEDAGKLLKIKLTYYARQSENVTWEEIAITNVETAINP